MFNYLIKIAIFIIIAISNESVNGLFEFPQIHVDINGRDYNHLDGINTEEWNGFLDMGISSVEKVETLEKNLMYAEITVKNGSISHTQLLDTLPNSAAKEDSITALKILRSSQYAYYRKCMDTGISGVQCEAYLATKKLPDSSKILADCMKITERRQNRHFQFRRLLPRHYKDGFYELFSYSILPTPRTISIKLANVSNGSLKKVLNNDNYINLAVVQWAQFIEHDLSKPVVSSMSNGNPIDCCDNENYKLLPRHHHPQCYPLLEADPYFVHGRETCLNYVRSALAVNEKCTFGAMEQLNQATGYLDLSQLYGFTEAVKQRMRAFKNGFIKVSNENTQLKHELLPLVSTDESHGFCALKLNANKSSCFLAGNSRVNSNPFSIVIYTIFMRNHNQLAYKLQQQHPNWTDELLFQVAKDINIDIYRRIVFNEWLPDVLGSTIAAEINEETLQNNFEAVTPQVSNEFAVAAIRFYYSMMPNTLNYFAALNQEDIATKSPITNNNILPDSNIFVLKEQIYTTNLVYGNSKLNEILESLLHQRPMKMDVSYVESLISDYIGKERPTHADIIALDIQRGRDHGLQGYVKYLEVCNKVNIQNWNDLEKFITKEDITKLKHVYNSWNDIDLIIGGIAEMPMNGSTLGATFSCILGEQFSKIRQWQQADLPIIDESRNELSNYKDIKGADVLCMNSDLKQVPQNIFQLASEKNPLISCK